MITRNRFEMATHELDVQWPTSEERATYLEHLDYMEALHQFRQDTINGLKELNNELAEFNQIWR